MVDDEPTPAPAKPVVAKAKPVAAKPVEVDDDDDDRPRSKRKSRDDDDEEEEDRPRRSSSRKRRDDDEEDDDRPRNRGRGKPTKKSGGFPIWIPIAGGGLLLLAVAVGAVMMFGGGGGKNGGGGGGLFGGGPPAGFSEINEAGITVYLHGKVNGQFVRDGGPNGPPNPNMYSANDNQGPFGSYDHSCMMFAVRETGFKPGPANKVNAKDAYEKGAFIEQLRKFDVVSTEEITIGGQPGVKMIVKEAPDLWEKDEQQKEFFKRQNDEERARIAKEGKVSAFLYVVNGEWKYLITVTNKLNDIDPNKLKTIIDSVKFK